MKRTGRRIPGAGADLVEVLGENGLKHTAIVFHDAHRDQPCLNGGLEVGMGFMEQPDVTGLSRLVAHAPEEGAFVYPTGTVWSVAELVRELADMGEVGGTKAALELCYMAGEILVEAADQGVHSGLLGHGCLDPWRVLLKADGQIVILGYGLPRPEIELHRETETRFPSEDSLRYCAPENLAEDAVHDLSSDLFTLCLIALELMVGRTVYDGLPADVQKQASRGEAVRRLYQWRDRIPETVREVLGKALKPDPDIRYRDGLDFVYSVHDLLGGIDAGDGPSLRALVTRIRARQKRGKAVVGGDTGALTKAELAELAADIDEEGAETELPTPRQPRPEDEEADEGEAPRWRRSTRGASRAETSKEESADTGRRRKRPTAKPASGSARDRLLQRLKRPSDENSGEVSSGRRRRRAPVGDDQEEPVRARRSRRGREEEPTPEPAQPPQRRPGGRAAALLERLRSTSGGKEIGTDEVTQVAKRLAAAGRTKVSKPAPVGDESEFEATVKHAPLDLSKMGPAPIRRAAVKDSDVMVGFDGPAIAVPRAGTAATVRNAAVDAFELPTTDLMGTCTASYRLLQDGGRVDLATPAADLTGSLVLERVPNSVVLATVKASGDPAVKVLTPLGTAVPVGLLKRSLRDLLGLEAGFELTFAGKVLSNDSILADVSFDDSPVIEVKR